MTCLLPGTQHRTFNLVPRLAMATDIRTSIPTSLSSPEFASHLQTIASHTSGERLTEDVAGENLPSSDTSLLSCIPVIPTRHFSCICPMSFSHLYRTIVLFALPTQYEHRIQTLEESPEALASLTSGAAFASEWFTAGGLCTIILP